MADIVRERQIVCEGIKLLAARHAVSILYN